MCRRVTCKTCGKPTWAGCGAHIDMVLGDVPKADRCSCREGGANKATAPARPKASNAPVATEPATSAVGRLKRWLQQ